MTNYISVVLSETDELKPDDILIVLEYGRNLTDCYGGNAIIYSCLQYSTAWINHPFRDRNIFNCLLIVAAVRLYPAS